MKWRIKIAPSVKLENRSTTCTKHIQNVKNVLSKEVSNVSKIKEIKYQFNKKKYYEKKRDQLLQKQNDYRNKRNKTLKNYIDTMLNNKTR